jgi:hypothetical protein
MASGGTIDKTARSGDSVAPSVAKEPAAIPRHRPAIAAMPIPMNRRFRLAAVSDQSRISPVRSSSVNAICLTASTICAALGSSLSSAFSASRRDEATP